MRKIQGLLRAFPTVFKDLMFMTNTDLSVKGIYYYPIEIIKLLTD